MTGLLYALLTAVTWAVAVVLFRRAGESMSPLVLNFHKNLVAMVLLAATFVLTPHSMWPDPAVNDVLVLLASGVVGLAVADTIFFASLNLLGASRAAIVDALYAPCVVLMSYVYLADRLAPRDAVGASLVVGGVLLTVGERAALPREGGRLLTGVLLGALAMALMAVAIVAVKPILDRYSVLWATSVRMTGGVVGLLAFGLLHRDGRRAIVESVRPQRAWRFALPGAIAGTYLSMLFWIAGFKYAPASLVAILNQTSTLWTVLLAWFFLGEAMTLRRTVAVTLAAAGGLLVVW